MRAGPLSNSEVIQILNEKFVNTWVLLRELPELISGAKGEGASLLATKLKQHYSDSVDILTLTSKAEVLAHQPEMALPYRNRAQHYLTLLRRSVEAFDGKFFSKLEARPISLGKKLKEVLHIFRASASGIPDYTLVQIDATSFTHGGSFHIEIQVGGGDATGTFELFDGGKETAIDEFSDDALTGAWDVPPGGTGHILHRFERGQRFKLRATGSRLSEKGSINAFTAHIYVAQ